MTFDELQKKVKTWGALRGITAKRSGDSATIQRYAQTLKVQEETGELCKAILENDEEKKKDAFGDSLVTLILLAEIEGYTLEECLKAAWDEIKGREGKLVNGTYIKNN